MKWTVESLLILKNRYPNIGLKQTVIELQDAGFPATMRSTQTKVSELKIKMKKKVFSKIMSNIAKNNNNRYKFEPKTSFVERVLKGKI